MTSYYIDIYTINSTCGVPTVEVDAIFYYTQPSITDELLLIL